MSNDTVLQITQAIQRIQHYKHQPLPLSDDEQSDCEAPFTVRSRAKDSDEDTAHTTTHTTTLSKDQLQNHAQVLKACCVRNTPIVTNWLYENITSLSVYLLNAVVAQLRKITL